MTFSRKNISFCCCLPHPIVEAERGEGGQNRLKFNCERRCWPFTHFPSLFTHQACKVGLVQSWPTLRPQGLPWGSPGKHTGAAACPPPGALPDPGIESRPPTLQADALPPEPPGKFDPSLLVTVDSTLEFCGSVLGLCDGERMLGNAVLSPIQNSQE